MNTLGNLGFVVAGLLMFWVLARDVELERPPDNRMIGRTPISMLYAAAAVFLGPGSMVMHGTHTFFGAWIDNVSMVAYIFVPVLYNLKTLGRWSNRTVFALYGLLLIGYGAGYWLIDPGLGINLELFEVAIPIWLITEALIRFDYGWFRWLSGLLGFGVAAVFGPGTPIGRYTALALERLAAEMPAPAAFTAAAHHRPIQAAWARGRSAGPKKPGPVGKEPMNARPV